MELSTSYVLILGLILGIGLLGMVGNIQLAAHYRGWLRNLQEYETRTEWNPETGTDGLLQAIVIEYRQHRLEGIEFVNTQALIEKKVYERQLRLFGVFRLPLGVVERLLHQLPSWSVIIGLLGTFGGLTLALFAMQRTLLQLGTGTGEEVITVSAIVSAIAEPFQGMSFAFITSIAGIGVSFCLHVLHSGLFSKLGFGPSSTQLRNLFLTRCESFLDHHVQLAVQREKPKDSLERILDRLVDKVKESFAESVQGFGDEILNMTRNLEESVHGLDRVIEQSAVFTAQFEQGVQQFTQFGQDLRQYVDQFGQHEQHITAEMAQLSKNIANLGQEFKQLTAKNDDSRQAMQRVVERSDQLVAQAVRKNEELFQFFQQQTEDIQRRFQESLEQSGRNYQMQQDEWFFRYQEKNDQFSRAAESFGQAVQHLERQWEDGLERLKRDIAGVVGQMERSVGRDHGGQQEREIREVARELQMIEHLLEREFQTQHRYAQDMQQILLNLSEGVRGQAHERA